MPISDREIWTAANLIVKRYGADAEIEAARRADAMLDRGVPEGQRVWLRIKSAIEALQAPVCETAPRRDPPVNPVKPLSRLTHSGPRRGPDRRRPGPYRAGNF